MLKNGAGEEEVDKVPVAFWSCARRVRGKVVKRRESTGRRG